MAVILEAATLEEESREMLLEMTDSETFDVDVRPSFLDERINCNLSTSAIRGNGKYGEVCMAANASETLESVETKGIYT